MKTEIRIKITDHRVEWVDIEVRLISDPNDEIFRVWQKLEGGKYVVDHPLTGGRIAEFDRKSSAAAFVNYLKRCGIDFNSLDVSEMRARIAMISPAVQALKELEQYREWRAEQKRLRKNRE